MRRREFIGFVGGAVAWPISARGQQPGSIRVVGVLTPHFLDPAFPALIEKLRELGYEDGRNMRFVIRSADSKLERLPDLATELVKIKADVIVAIAANTCRDHGDQGHPHCNGHCGKPCRHGIRQQPGAPGREYHWYLEHVR